MSKDLDWLDRKFIKRKRDKKRAKAYKRILPKCYVGSNIERMWWGKEAMTNRLNKNGF